MNQELKHSFSERNEILLGQEGMDTLKHASVAVLGLGGVGGACALDLVRSGVGHLHVLDFDLVAVSNLNRLAYGYQWNVGMEKVRAFSRAALAINPDLRIESFGSLVGQDTRPEDLPRADIWVDAIDTLNAKVGVLAFLLQEKYPFISSTGMGGRMDPAQVRLGEFWKVQVDPLAREVRNRLRRRGVSGSFPCVHSTEVPALPAELSPEEEMAHRARQESWAQKPEGVPPGRLRRRQGTMPFVPQTAGHLLASWVVRRLLGLVPPWPNQ